MDKISWDSYFLTLAFVAAQRSIDPNTKCGAVIVSKDKRVLSMGYNGPIKNSHDDKIPLTRPEKYYHMIHGEENALLAYNGSFQDISEATAYVTGRPCHKCLRMLLQKGIKRIVYSNANVTKVVDAEDMKAQQIMLNDRDEKIEIVEVGSDGIFQLLNNTVSYINRKLTENKNY